MLVIKQFGPVTYAMGTLQEILAGTGIAAKVRALPNDVAGCTLEMGADGKWVGTLGSLSKATADALYASGALANLATGATCRDTSGTQYTYSAGAGWMLAGDIGPGSPASPFTTEAERTAWATANLSSLRSGASTVWGPGAVEYVWNGPLAADWTKVVKAASPYGVLAAIKVGKSITANVLGDSLSSLWSDVNAAWWQRLQQITNERIKFTYSFAVSGTGIQYHIDNFPANGALHPADVCFIHLLTNNVTEFTGIAAATKMLELCNLVRSAGQEPIVIGIGPLDTYPTRTLNSQYINKAVRDMCLANGILNYNPNEAFRDISTGGWLTAYRFDNRHYNVAGPLVVAQELVRQMTDLNGIANEPIIYPGAKDGQQSTAFPIYNPGLIDSNSDGLADNLTVPHPTWQTNTNTLGTDNKRIQTFTLIAPNTSCGCTIPFGKQLTSIPGDVYTLVLPLTVHLAGVTIDAGLQIYMYITDTPILVQLPFFNGDFSGVLRIPFKFPTDYVNTWSRVELRLVPTAGYTEASFSITSPHIVNERLKAIALETYVGT